jgi:hypothetical protein
VRKFGETASPCDVEMSFSGRSLKRSISRRCTKLFLTRLKRPVKIAKSGKRRRKFVVRPVGSLRISGDVETGNLLLKRKRAGGKSCQTFSKEEKRKRLL